MSSVHPQVVAVEAALREVGDALAAADLERLLAAETGLTAALGCLGVTERLEGSGAIELKGAIDRAYSELLRCRRLGNSLVAYTQLTTDPSGDRAYGRRGVAAVGGRISSLDART